MTRREVRSTSLRYEDETRCEARRLEGMEPEGWSMELRNRQASSIVIRYIALTPYYNLTPTLLQDLHLCTGEVFLLLLR